MGVTPGRGAVAELPFTGGNSVLFGVVALVFLALGSIAAIPCPTCP